MTRKIKTLLASATVAAAMMTATAANAATLLFNFVGLPGQTGSFTFNINSSPVAGAGDPKASTNSSFSSSITDATGSLLGKSSLFFYTAISGGGLGTGTTTSVDLIGSQLFSGTIASPTFVNGSYLLASNFTLLPQGTLTISNAVAAVPEPATWALMIVGVGAVGFSMRSARRRSDQKFDDKIKRITGGALA